MSLPAGPQEADRPAAEGGGADASSERAAASRQVWMGMLFGVGSTCFFLAPFPGYESLVGATATAITFFVGSLLFTGGGGVQTWLAAPDRREAGAGRAAWWVAVVQSAGTLFFNVSTYHALQTVLSNPNYDQLVWRPDAFGSICFLVSGTIGYVSSPRRGWRPRRGASGWWVAAVNLLGCVFFGIAAVAGFVIPSSASLVDQGAANWNTSAGAACFLACAVWAVIAARAPLHGGRAA